MAYTDEYDLFSTQTNDDADLIRRNKEAVSRWFSLERSGERLLELYQQAWSSPRGAPPEPLAGGDHIFQQFLDFRRFRLLHSETVPGGQ